MNKTNETTPRREAQDDIILLGVASVETQGNGGFVESTGIGAAPEISEE